MNKHILFAVGFILVVALGYYMTFYEPSEPDPVKAQIQITLLGVDKISASGALSRNDTIAWLEGMADVEVASTRELDTVDSLELAKRYNISALPAVIIEGEFALVKSQFDEIDDALIGQDSMTPYYSIEAGRMLGKFDVIEIVDSTCNLCVDPREFYEQFDPVFINSTTRLDVNSPAGKRLIDKYRFSAVPHVILSKEVLETEWGPGLLDTDEWGQSEHGTVVYYEDNPPYRDLETGKLEGLVNMTLIVDNGCEACYDVRVLQEWFDNSWDFYYQNVTAVDVSSARGELLVKKYDIKAVPTVVLSQGAGVYRWFQGEWITFGSREDDGSYVLRDMEAISTNFREEGRDFVYRDLASGKTVVLEP